MIAPKFCLCFRTSLLMLLVWSSWGSVAADITLPKIFSDNMVLQRNSTAKIYGSAEPNQLLTVQLGDDTQSVTADENGSWSVNCSIGPAGGPYDLIVTAEAGQPQVKLSNVMFGEVWLCSGQSNMEWPVKNVLNSKTEIDQSINYPNIRLFTVEQNASLQPLKQFEKVSGWDVCSPESVGQFSGTAYFFARELSKKFPDMPIGLIDSSWGGTACEAWVSRRGLEQVPSLKGMLDNWDSVATEGDKNRPAVLFNGMISPLHDFNIRGVLWYQGERNNGRGAQYQTLLPTLIADWRSFFGQAKMPFYFVQLAPFRYAQKPPEGLAEVWDAQLKTLKNVPQTGMVVTTDIGNVDDIHPKNKQEVGRRLSLLALAHLYREQLPEADREFEFSGPIFDGFEQQGQSIVVKFKHAQGLRSRDNQSPLTHFSISGPDGQFVPAEAEIVDDTIVVSSPKVSDPQAVRFGWSDTAQPNLVNSAGLPASPFRTDQFELLSEGKDF